MQQRIGEPIETIVIYGNDKISPVKFRWQNRVYRITNITGRWIDKEGVYKKYFFAVECGGDEVYELYLHTRDMVWHLNSLANLSRPF
jgi:hypothetical protein